MSPLEIIVTGDGSHSLLNKTLNETYHSVHGARRESEHVFIKHGLEYFISDGRKSVSIFEVGFGTGLNALLTTQFNTAASIEYTSIETAPIEKAIWSKLNYAVTPEEHQVFEKIHGASWSNRVQISPLFILEKLHTSIHDVAFAAAFDIVYFDAFAPNKQPDMWTAEVLQKVFDAMRTPGIFVTYCAQGQLKRDLRTVGFKVESLPGPPGKREMTRALKI